MFDGGCVRVYFGRCGVSAEYWLSADIDKLLLLLLVIETSSSASEPNCSSSSAFWAASTGVIVVGIAWINLCRMNASPTPTLSAVFLRSWRNIEGRPIGLCDAVRELNNSGFDFSRRLSVDSFRMS